MIKFKEFLNENSLGKITIKKVDFETLYKVDRANAKPGHSPISYASDIKPNGVALRYDRFDKVWFPSRYSILSNHDIGYLGPMDTYLGTEQGQLASKLFGKRFDELVSIALKKKDEGKHAFYDYGIMKNVGELKHIDLMWVLPNDGKKETFILRASKEDFQKYLEKHKESYRD